MHVGQNPPGDDAMPKGRIGLSRLAGLPIPILLVAIMVTRAAGLHQTYEFPNLRLLLSSTFYTLVSLGTLFLIARSFLATGAPGLLLLECGVLLWCLAGTVADKVFHGDANIDVTIFNIGIALSGMCHLVGSILTLWPQRAVHAKRLWLAVACALSLGALWLITWATLHHRLPIFFIQGSGGTLVRYCVLISAIAMFVLSAALLSGGPRANRAPFTAWYVLAMLSMAVGLLGITIQLSLGSAVNWLARTAEWLGGVYLFLAAVAAWRQSTEPLLPSSDNSRPVYYRHGVAAIAVLIAAAVRFGFSATLGTHSPFVTFYPAVILAALYGGRRAGLLATFLSVIVADYFWIGPTRHFTIGQPQDWLAAVIFLASGILVSLVTEAMHRAQAQAAKAEAELQTAQALRQSEQRFQALAEATFEGIAIAEKGRLTDANEQLFKMLGYRREELIGMEILSLMPPEDRQRIASVIAQGRESNVEHWIIRKDGTRILVEAHGKTIEYQNRKVRFTAIRDITQRKQAQETLQESEARFHSTLDNSRDCIYRLNLQTNLFDYISPAVQTISGFTPEELMTMDAPTGLAMVHPDDLPGFQAALAQLEAEGQVEAEYRQRTKSGEYRWLSNSMSLTRDHAGRPQYRYGNIRDISQRKQAAAETARLLTEVQDRAAMLDATISSAAAGLIIYDPAGKAIRTSNIVNELLPLELFVNKTAQERQQVLRWEKEDGQPFLPEEIPLMRALRGQTTRNVVMATSFADHKLWISASAAPIRNAAGKMLGAVASFIDITERKQAQEMSLKRAGDALRLSEQEFHSLAEAMPQIVWATRPDGWNIYFNQHWVDYTGMTLEESYGHGWNKPFHADDQQRAWDAWQRATQHGERYSLECRLRRHDGVYRWWLIRGEPMRGANGEILKWFGTCTDIEEIKNAEAALQAANDLLEQRVAERTAELRQSEEQFHTLADAITNLAWWANADGYITWYNRRWYEYTGTTPEQMEGWGWQSVHDPQALPQIMERWKDSLATGQPFDMTFPLRGADGQFRRFLTRIRPLKDAQGRVLRWFGTNTDVEELKQAEEALAAAKLSAEHAKAAAEHANKAKDHFLAVLSHELRNPLNPVLATAAMLRGNPHFDADTREQLEVICRNAEMEARLIDDLLDVTRIERGKIELDCRPVDLLAIIHRAIEVCLPDMQARKLEFGIDSPDGPYWIGADAGRMQQVFWNLLKNAVKFTPAGGCVGIRCRRQGDAVVMVEVNDSGEGMDPGDIGRIFNAFEQTSRNITRQFGGLGLGLTISKGLVDMHGGTIQASSPGKGKGSTFTVRLPLIPAPVEDAIAAPAFPPPEPATAARPLQILLVEDHGDTARIMRRLLSASGHQVKHAGDVATALKLAGEHSFDLVLSDLGLPDGSGLDLMRTLRAKGIKMPGIALSGYGQEKDIKQSLEAGFTAHMTKPVNLPKLEETIAKITTA